jgi:DegT/DnrJ/EryC1/StrS aminotransferase family
LADIAVPFTDVAAMVGDVWPAIEEDYLTCLLGGTYTGGPAVASFEQQWAAYCGADFAVGVANGTDALELTLTALGIGRGDEVVVPANTFIATAAAVVRVGAVPRFADVSDDTLLMTPENVQPSGDIPYPRGHRGASVRTGAGHGRYSRRRGPGGAVRHRRRRAGAWSRMERPSRGVVRHGRLLQLLPRQEPWRLRRRGCGGHLGAVSCRSRPDTGEPRPIPP